MIYKDPKIYKGPGLYKGASLYKGAGIYKYLDSGDITEVIIGGKTYPVVKIGSLYWTTYNIDYVDDNIILGGAPTFDNNNAHAWYYQNDENQFGWNGKKFGLLYNNLAVEYLETNKNTLLNGFRVPGEADYQNLEHIIGQTDFIKKLKSTKYWYMPGTNENLFDMVPGGSCSGDANNPIVWDDIYIQSNLRIVTIDHNGMVFRANNDNSYQLSRYVNNAFGYSLRLCRNV